MPNLNQADRKPANRAVIILGMHRSGTSCLAGSLEAAGLRMGDVVEWAPRNAKGNRESLDIRKLNNLILEDNGGSWFAPPEEVKWSSVRKGVRDRLIAQFRGIGQWGFKDPRTLLTLEGWLEALPNAAFVGTFRHPSAVVQSLEFASDRLSLDDKELLWIHYNRRLLDSYRRRPFPILCFDWDNARYSRALAKAARALGLNEFDECVEFFDPALRKNRVLPEMKISSEALAIYDALADAAMLDAG